MFSLRIVRSISRKPPCLPRRVGLVGLGVVPVFFYEGEYLLFGGALICSSQIFSQHTHVHTHTNLNRSGHRLLGAQCTTYRNPEITLRTFNTPNLT